MKEVKGYLPGLAEQCLKTIPGLPEIANLNRTAERWTITAELKDKEGDLHTAEIRWQFCRNETNELGFALFTVIIGTGILAQRKLYFRAHYYGDDTLVDYVGSKPNPMSFGAWYEGGVVNSTSLSNICTRCDVLSDTVQQAYWGGAPIMGEARCKTCRQRPYPAKKVPTSFM